MSERLLLIDGHSIINRAFYAIPEMTNVKGVHTNGIYGFLNIVLKFMDEEHPDYCVVAFDLKAPTFRHEMYKEYKGTRKPMPAELHEQVPVLKEVLKSMNIVTFSKEGWEADDILGSLAKRAEADGIEVSLVSGDRDLLQISSEHIKICLPRTKGGQTTVEEFYPKDVLEKYQVSPAGIIELKALMGDSSDNIPGVPKVGEKTATGLLVQYGDLDGVYAHLHEISKPALHKNLEENKELAYLSKTLATIKTDCDIPLTWDECRLDNMWNEQSQNMFMELGFKSFMKRFDTETVSGGKVSEDVAGDFHLVTDFGEVEDELGKLKESSDIAFCLEKEAGQVVSLSITTDTDTYVFPVQWFVTEDILLQGLKDIIDTAKGRVITFDIKKCYDHIDCEDTTRYEDILLMAYLCNPLKSDYTLEDVAIEYMDLFLQDRKQLFNKQQLSDVCLERPDEYCKYAGMRSYVIYHTFARVRDRLEVNGMSKLYRDIEMPLSAVLYQCERIGIGLDVESLKQYGEELSGEIDALEQKIYSQAGIEFNINSPKQLGEILFERMGLTGGKKTKTGYSTAADVLEKLADDNPIVADILEYRGLTKLKSTYIEGLQSAIGRDGRIHTTFNQTITATGRISSTEPNLQNIPIRTEAGRLIRKSFVPKPGYVFVDADYSQIELRLLAHMSSDEGLIEAYNSEADIHRITAAKVFGVPFEEVTPDMRRNAKAVNFGIVYGISSFGLSQDLDIDRKQAAKYIEDYFVTYPGVKAYLDTCVSKAKEDGYVTTMYDRRRPIPELKNSNFMVRSFGERVAMNSPIQGSAADIMKIAMIRVHDALKASGLDARILVQVHDELLLEVKESEAHAASELLEREMDSAANLRVPLEVDVHTGNNWYETK